MSQWIFSLTFNMTTLIPFSLFFSFHQSLSVHWMNYLLWHRLDDDRCTFNIRVSLLSITNRQTSLFNQIFFSSSLSRSVFFIPPGKKIAERCCFRKSNGCCCFLFDGCNNWFESYVFPSPFRPSFRFRPSTASNFSIGVYKRQAYQTSLTDNVE